MTAHYKLPENIQQLYEDGQKLKENILIFLDAWPKDEKSFAITFEKTDVSHQDAVSKLIIETRRWFNKLNLEVLPHIVYDRQFIYFTLRKVEAAIKKCQYIRPYVPSGPQTIEVVEYPFSSPSSHGDTERRISLERAKEEAKEGMEIALNLVQSVPESSTVVHQARQPQPSAYTPNTAFIIMWMDSAHPELDDVRNAIKEICNDFGIRALRADEVEHQDKITDVILQQIASSEFLIADLTGERPNVYYEVGYAHAIGKRPILYRKQGTTLHFDLSVHNVPEYKNITELKEHLNKRFEAILGRRAGQS